MGRMEEMEARLKARMDAMNSRLGGRMAAALGTRLGSVGEGPEPAKSCKSEDAGGANVLEGVNVVAANLRRVALCVGMKDLSRAAYFPNVPNSLPGCTIDVDRFACALKWYGFQENSVLTLKNEEATCMALYGAILRVAASLKGGDLFVLFISGHGNKDSWCLYDGLLDSRHIVWMLSRFNAGVRILVVNDQCHSGAFFSAKGLDSESDIGIMCAKDGCDDKWNPETAWHSRDFPMVIQFASSCAEQQSIDGVAGGWWAQTLINVLDQRMREHEGVCSYKQWFELAQSQVRKSGVQVPFYKESPNVTDVFRCAPALK